MLQRLLFVLVAAVAASASADAATLMSKVHKIVHRAGSLSPSKQAEKFLNSTFSPPGKTRLFGALDVRIKHTDAEGMPTWRYVRVPIDVTAKGTMDYNKASLTKFRVKGLVLAVRSIPPTICRFFSHRQTWLSIIPRSSSNIYSSISFRHDLQLALSETPSARNMGFIKSQNCPGGNTQTQAHMSMLCRGKIGTTLTIKIHWNIL